ncbi:unnamed protein product [Clavelina lepadiformis]|uniref:Protein kinase domain-containing protein n=1 Tax=Clavelina lepadiformis TaxID=159417 RepID=A0ABP0F0F2_CLALP
MKNWYKATGINLDGYIVRNDKSKPCHGHLVLTSSLTEKENYFEVTILHQERGKGVVVGLVPTDYNFGHNPGWAKDSFGYWPDGSICTGSLQRTCQAHPYNSKDSVGCGLRKSKLPNTVEIFFTRNGKKVWRGEVKLGQISLHPAVVLSSEVVLEITVCPKIVQEIECELLQNYKDFMEERCHVMLSDDQLRNAHECALNSNFYMINPGLKRHLLEKLTNTFDRLQIVYQEKNQEMLTKILEEVRKLSLDHYKRQVVQNVKNQWVPDDVLKDISDRAFRTAIAYFQGHCEKPVNECSIYLEYFGILENDLMQCRSCFISKNNERKENLNDVCRQFSFVCVKKYEDELQAGISQVTSLESFQSLHCKAHDAALIEFEACCSKHPEFQLLFSSSILLFLKDLQEVEFQMRKTFERQQVDLKAREEEVLMVQSNKYREIMEKKCKKVNIQDGDDLEHIHQIARCEALMMTECRDVKVSQHRFDEMIAEKKEHHRKIYQLKLELKHRSHEMEKMTKLDKMGLMTSLYHPPRDILALVEDGFLGRGTYGVVRRVFTKSHSALAVKCLPVTGSAEEISEKMRKCVEEMKLLYKVRHTNLVDIVGYTQWHGAMGILLEYLPGGTLCSLLFSEVGNRFKVPFIPAVVQLRISTEVAAAMSYLHDGSTSQQRITHGDLKPQNILLTADLHCKLSDLGGAELATCSGNTTTADAEPRHKELTPVYAAPERLRGPTKTRTSMDTFSFAMTLRAALIRKHPHQNTKEDMSPDQYVVLIRSSHYRPPLDDVDDLKASLTDEADVAIIDLLKDEMVKCWEHNPDERPSMMDVRDRLLQCLSTKDQSVIAQHVADITKYIDIKVPSYDPDACKPIQHFHPPNFDFFTFR